MAGTITDSYEQSYGTLRVTLLSASGLLAADKGGKSDPYVKLTLDGRTQKSAVVKKTLSPVWNADFEWTGDKVRLPSLSSSSSHLLSSSHTSSSHLLLSPPSLTSSSHPTPMTHGMMMTWQVRMGLLELSAFDWDFGKKDDPLGSATVNLAAAGVYDEGAGSTTLDAPLNTKGSVLLRAVWLPSGEDAAPLEPQLSLGTPPS